MRSENVYYSAQAVEGSIPQCMEFMKRIWTRTDMTEEQKRKVLGENAARFFKLPPE